VVFFGFGWGAVPGRVEIAEQRLQIGSCPCCLQEGLKASSGRKGRAWRATKPPGRLCASMSRQDMADGGHGGLVGCVQWAVFMASVRGWQQQLHASSASSRNSENFQIGAGAERELSPG